MTPLNRFLPDPELIPPCSRCGDRDSVQIVIEGFPAFTPSSEEEDRVRLAGCMIEADSPAEAWWCRSCESGYPWSNPFERTLLVKEPWVDLLMDGVKTWELRRSSTKVRGLVGLTPSGSGVIAGAAELQEVHGPLSVSELRSHFDKHLVDDQFLESYAAGGLLFAWEFSNARRYENPADYHHPQGAVIWVKLPTVGHG